MQGDITHITDSDGNVEAEYVYDAWGSHKVFDASGSEIGDPDFIGNVNPIRYRGYYFDSETGLYYLKTRYYDPEAGRFLSPDGLSNVHREAINGLNLYAYCGNNPVMFTDHSGECFLCGAANFIGKAVASVVTTVVAAGVSAATAAATWVNDNVILPIVTTAVEVVSWVDTNFVQPVANFIDENIDAIVAVAVVALSVTAIVAGVITVNPLLVWAGAGALVEGAWGGYTAYREGTSIASGILAGAIAGAGAAAAGPLGGFLAGLASYAVETIGNNREFKIEDMLAKGGLIAIESSLSAGVGHWMKGEGMVGEVLGYYFTKLSSGHLDFFVDLSSGRYKGKGREALWRYLRTWLP
jgi:RHS repeat-associated protein